LSVALHPINRQHLTACVVLVHTVHTESFLTEPNKGAFRGTCLVLLYPLDAPRGTTQVHSTKGVLTNYVPTVTMILQLRGFNY